MKEEISVSPMGEMSAREARGLAVVIGAQKGVPVRYVQDDLERERLQAADKTGHVWRVGEAYYAMAEIRAKK